MHVLFDARLLHRPLSGIERVQRNLLRALDDQREIRRLQVVVKKGTQLPDSFPKRAEVVEVQCSEDILAVLLHENPKERPDVYHLTYFPDREPHDIWLPLAAKASVVEVHDAILNRHPEYYENAEKHGWYCRFVKRLVANANRLLVHSKSVMQEVENDLDGDASRCDLAPLAVEPSMRRPLERSEVKRRLEKMGVEGKYFLAIGKDYPHKDHQTLFRALVRLDEQKERHVKLICAGTAVWAEEGETTADRIRDLGLEDRVRWISDLSDEDVKALIQGTEALVYPSTEEGFGLPPIEAMALGTPVLAAKAMSVPEVCGDAAWLHEPGDDKQLAKLMRRVLARGKDVEELTDRGLAREARYTWERCAEATVKCYRAAIQAAKQGAKKGGARGRTPAWIRECMGILGQSPYSDARLLADWQERCLSVENQLSEVTADREQIGRNLRELREEMRSRQDTPRDVRDVLRDEPESERPRWSIKRRIDKIRRSLAKD